jgi:hypothetical protein
LPHREPRVEERRDTGAIVYLIAHALGDFEVVSIDRRVHASGSSLDVAWARYHKKARAVMRKDGTLAKMREAEALTAKGEQDAIA